ncbi:MAG TPA: DUF5668 domain-containing protein [Acidisarcina sp.]|nr:DUF5668 domain-containing protein [Acidisarcina sp.]
MNCANHPETPVEAYCQLCGKALCSQCVHSISGIVACESCIAARLGVAGNAKESAGKAPYPATGPLPPAYNGDAKPMLAGFLGFIPGVGAMYNGQFVKALVHVLIFAILISISNQNGIFGLFIAAWVFYQIFDAYQTAKARRDGLPLPDPFGLNDLGARLGLHPAQAAIPVPPATYAPVPPASYTPPATAPGDAGYPQATAQSPYDSAAYQVAGYAPPPPQTPYEAYPPPIPPVLPPRRPEPVGAIVLIGLGVLFLLSSLGIFSMHWIGHGWPIFLIALGGWLIYRRTRDVPDGGTK